MSRVDIARAVNAIMPYKDRLKELIEQHGGRTEPNLVSIVELVRKICSTFSMVRLVNLLNGLPPSPNERQAISMALGESPGQFLDGNDKAGAENRRRIVKFASDPDRMGRPEYADQFYEFVMTKVSYRNRVISNDDLYALVPEFLASID